MEIFAESKKGKERSGAAEGRRTVGKVLEV